MLAETTALKYDPDPSEEFLLKISMFGTHQWRQWSCGRVIAYEQIVAS